MAYEEDDLTSRAKGYGSTQIAIGHVDGVYDKGDPTGQPGNRHTLILVTLGGSNQSELKGPRGRQICCALSSLAGGRIPKDGTRVIIAMPDGMEETPGAAVVIATIEDDPIRLEADRRVLDYTGEHVIIKGKSVVLESDDGHFVSVGAPRSGGVSGVTICLHDGTGAVWQTAVASMFVASGGDAKTILQLTTDKAELVQKDIGFVRLGDGELHTFAPVNKMQGAGCYIGKLPAIATPALYGETGIAGVASLGVFISAT